MKISGNTQIDLSLADNIDNLNLSNLNYEVNFNTSNGNKKESNVLDFEISSKKNENKNENSMGVESNFGPLCIKLNLVSDKDKIPEDLEDLNFNVLATYNYDKKFNFGLKYESDANQEKFEVLSGTMSTNIKLDSLDLNLATENIIYGYENRNDNKINLFGNKIYPSIGILDNSLELGLLYDQKEEIDEYGNKEENIKNKLCFDLNLKI